MIALAFPLLVGCASNKPQTSAGMDTSQMEKSEDLANTLVYRAPEFDNKKYTQFLIDSAQVYRGSDAKFKGVSEEDRAILTQFLYDEFVRVLTAKSMLATGPGPNVARIKLVLADVEKTKPMLSTASHLMPIGAMMNVGKSAAGMRGSFMGAATVAGDIYDSQSGNLVFSFLTKQAPLAMDMTDTFTSMDAAKTGIRQTAEKFADRVEQIQKGK